LPYSDQLIFTKLAEITNTGRGTNPLHVSSIQVSVSLSGTV